MGIEHRDPSLACVEPSRAHPLSAAALCLCAVLCDKPCTLRFKHADDACIYNSITGTLKRAGFVEQLATTGRERFAWNLRWGKHMMPEAFKDLKSYQKINHFPVQTRAHKSVEAGVRGAHRSVCVVLTP